MGNGNGCTDNTSIPSQHAPELTIPLHAAMHSNAQQCMALHFGCITTHPLRQHYMACVHHASSCITCDSNARHAFSMHCHALHACNYCRRQHAPKLFAQDMVEIEIRIDSVKCMTCMLHSISTQCQPREYLTHDCRW